MEGIPEDVLQAHQQRVAAQYHQAETERQAATGNPPAGSGMGGQPAKRPKLEDVSDLKKRLAEHRAKKAEAAAGGSSGEATPVSSGPPAPPYVPKADDAYVSSQPVSNLAQVRALKTDMSLTRDKPPLCLHPPPLNNIPIPNPTEALLPLRTSRSLVRFTRPSRPLAGTRFLALRLTLPPDTLLRCRHTLPLPATELLHSLSILGPLSPPLLHDLVASPHLLAFHNAQPSAHLQSMRSRCSRCIWAT